MVVMIWYNVADSQSNGDLQNVRILPRNRRNRRPTVWRCPRCPNQSASSGWLTHVACQLGKKSVFGQFKDLARDHQGQRGPNGPTFKGGWWKKTKVQNRQKSVSGMINSLSIYILCEYYRYIYIIIYVQYLYIYVCVLCFIMASKDVSCCFLVASLGGPWSIYILCHGLAGMEPETSMENTVVTVDGLMMMMIMVINGYCIMVI